jgi:hypothetical protein
MIDPATQAQLKTAISAIARAQIDRESTYGLHHVQEIKNPLCRQIRKD